MADSAVAVTAGSGTNVDTRTEGTNGNHRAVIVIGDPATNAGVAPVDGTAGLKVDLGADNDVTVTNATAANLKVDGSDVTQPVSGTVTETNSTAILADTANMDTNLGTVAGAVSGSEMQVDVVGALPAGTNAIGKLAANSGVDIGDVDVTSVDGVAAEGAALGNGILLQGDDGTDRKNVNVDATTGDVQVDVTNTVTVDATNSGDVPITLDSEAVVLGAGSAAIGKLAANSGVDIGDVDVTSISAGTNTVGGVFPVVSTSGTGTSTFYDADLDETKQEVTDNATVMIYSIAAFNTTAAPLFLQMWDLDADNVTVGTTAPTNQYVIPGNADSDGAGFTLTFAVPKAYTTGFTVACTTDSEGSSAPGAGACIVNIEYKA